MNRLRGVFPILLGLLYGVSPIDLIPDILPLIGLVDDAVIVTLLIGIGIMQMRRRPTPATIKIHPPQR